jgi:DNA polymerase-3 subunit beta
MKFYCEKSALLDAVTTASRAVSAKSAIPALEGLLIKAEDTVTVSGFNLEIGIVCGADANITEKGSAIFNARLFSEIVRKLPNDTVYITVDENNKITIKCGLSIFDLTSIPAEEFPELPVVESEQQFIIPAGKLCPMISKTVFAASTSDAKPILMGSLFDIKGNKIRIVSTDNFRLAVCEEILDSMDEKEFSFIIPANTLREIEKIMGTQEENVKINLAKKHTQIEIGNTMIVSRLLEGQFFKYENSLTIPVKNSVKVKTEAIAECVERVTPVINEKLRNPIKLKFEDGAVKLSYTSSIARAYDECIYDGSCESIEIGLSNRYLLDALHAIEDEDIRLEFNTPSSPFIIKPCEGTHFFYMIAPVRPV